MRAIDAENIRIKPEFMHNVCGMAMIRVEDVVRILNEQPTIQPKRGKWIRDGHHIRCDQCGMYMCDTDREGDRIPTEFCPNCGAKMEVDDE